LRFGNALSQFVLQIHIEYTKSRLIDRVWEEKFILKKALPKPIRRLGIHFNTAISVISPDPVRHTD